MQGRMLRGSNSIRLVIRMDLRAHSAWFSRVFSLESLQNYWNVCGECEGGSRDRLG